MSTMEKYIQRRNKNLERISKNFVEKYIDHIYTLIQSKKDTDMVWQKIDNDYDLYEILFIEGMDEALMCDSGIRIFAPEIREEIGSEIKHILEEDGVYRICLIHKKAFLLICYHTFRNLLEQTFNDTL